MKMQSKLLGKCEILLVWHLFGVFLVCNGTIWKTEDAYIIDDIDLPEEVSTQSIPQESDTCVDSTGSIGRCVPLSECMPFYTFFHDQETKKEPNIEILQGLQDYLNGTESCSNGNDSAEANTTYVCCTSIKYAKFNNINLSEYLANNDTDESDSENEIIPQATMENLNLAKIVSGSPANPGEFPFIVAITSNGKQFCGGSLIDSKWVLSAAHCFDRFNSQSVRGLVIKIGDHDIYQTSEVSHQDHLVSKLFLHPGFFRSRGFFRDDVALIKLKSPVTPGSNIRTVALHQGTPDITRGLVEAVVSGWGKTCAADGCPLSTTLRKAKLTILTNAQCSQKYMGTSAPQIISGMVCGLGTSGRDACNGDSGGPLVIYGGNQASQIGIVSWGIGCGQYPGVYTRVSNYIGWINKHKQKA